MFMIVPAIVVNYSYKNVTREGSNYCHVDEI